MARRVGRGAQVSVPLLLDRARKEAGLSDFGDESFLAPLASLIDLINGEAALETDDTPGIQLMVRYLADRLQLIDFLRQHPDVLEEEIEVPGIIIAHARGGSTLTHRLLTASDQFTYCHQWELEYPVPLPGEERGNPVQRRKMAQANVDEFMQAYPEYAAIHPVNIMDASEEVLLMDRSFQTMMFNCYFNLPGFSAWLLKQDHTLEYRELRVWLQLLQHQDPSRRGKKWLLKAPHHFMGGALSTMLEAFPEAKAIMSHRDLTNVIGSFCSSWVPYLRNYAPGVEDHGLGLRLVDWYADSFEAMEAARERHPGRFIDLQYRDTMADPIAQYQRALEQLEIEVRPRDIAAARSWMAANQRGTHPAHYYRLEDYGLSAAMIADCFADYHRKYVR